MKKGFSMRIVIVEDEYAIREGLANIINGNTLHTVAGKCKSGDEGIDLIKRVKPDCVITDIRMDGMTGLQMLSILHEEGAMPYSIIISGYSEFEYAREGIRLGVEEYLLKPISVDALEKALHKIEGKILENHNMFGSRLENYLRAYIFGTENEIGEAKRELQKALPDDGKKYGIFAGYYGNIENETEKLERLLRHLKRQYPEYVYLDAAEGRLKLRIMIVKAPEREFAVFAEEFDEHIVGDWSIAKYEIPWAFAVCSSVEEWRDAFAEIQKAMPRCLAEGCHRLLFVEEGTVSVEGRQSVPVKKELVYPVHLEKKLLAALGEGNRETAGNRIDEFLEYIIRREYAPEDIRRSVLKVVTTMLDTAEEINQKAYELLREENCMQSVLNVYTRTEIRDILHRMGRMICEKEKREDISNYTINRTVEYIRIHYKEGITLEETAEALKITPEYLSMLFKREMGMNFSVFLKEFRISHAKRLLKGTDMKVYEVAEACGYNNSNYFTKVFKDVTGMSPADYR